MPKFKPHKGLLKRVRVTKNGKVKCRVARGSHLRSDKPTTQLRAMRKPRYITSKGILRRMSRLLGQRLEPATKESADAATSARSS